MEAKQGLALEITRLMNENITDFLTANVANGKQETKEVVKYPDNVNEKGLSCLVFIYLFIHSFIHSFHSLIHSIHHSIHHSFIHAPYLFIT